MRKNYETLRIQRRVYNIIFIQIQDIDPWKFYYLPIIFLNYAHQIIKDLKNF